MYNLVNAYDMHKMEEREVIRKAEQHRIALETAPIKTKPNRTLTRIGKLLIDVGTNLVERHSQTDVTLPVIQPKTLSHRA